MYANRSKNSGDSIHQRTIVNRWWKQEINGITLRHFVHIVLSQWNYLLVGVRWGDCSYLLSSHGSCSIRCHARRRVGDIGLLRGCRLVALIVWWVAWLSPPSVLASRDWSSTIVLLMVPASWGESGLWRPIGKVRASRLGWCVLPLGIRGSARLLLLLLLRTRLSCPCLHTEGRLARGWGRAVGSRYRLLRSCRRWWRGCWSSRWRCLRLGSGLFGGSQRWLGGDYHAFIACNRSIRARHRQGGRILCKVRNSIRFQSNRRQNNCLNQGAIQHTQFTYQHVFWGSGEKKENINIFTIDNKLAPVGDPAVMGYQCVLLCHHAA